MRNRFAGPCYYCGETVQVNAGHFEKVRNGRYKWRTIHAECVFKQRAEKEKLREQENSNKQPCGI